MSRLLNKGESEEEVKESQSTFWCYLHLCFGLKVKHGSFKIADTHNVYKHFLDVFRAYLCGVILTAVWDGGQELIPLHLVLTIGNLCKWKCKSGTQRSGLTFQFYCPAALWPPKVVHSLTLGYLPCKWEVKNLISDKAMKRFNEISV